MLYHSRGIAHGFSGNYDEYFGLSVDHEGVVYLMLANYMLHELYPNAVTIAEVCIRFLELSLFIYNFTKLSLVYSNNIGDLMLHLIRNQYPTMKVHQ